jgi:hypothetical protein
MGMTLIRMIKDAYTLNIVADLVSFHTLEVNK